MKLTLLRDSFFKLEPLQSIELPASEKYAVAKGENFEVLAHCAAPNGHVKITLDKQLMPANRNTWYAFAGHVRVDGLEPGNAPKDRPAEHTSTGPHIYLPGYESKFFLDSPIIKGGNFTWREATHDGTRIPENKQIVDGIIRVAKVMEDVRDRFGGKAVTINSWYRPPAVNAAVGGASQSRHLVGDAVDFTIDGVSTWTVYDALDSTWNGGLASASCFTHLDTRPYLCRWEYGF